MASPNPHQNLAIDAFRAAVDMGYQNGSKLIDSVRVQRGVMAQSYRFAVAGQVDAGSRGSKQEVQVSEVRSTKPTAYLTPRESWDYIDKQDDAITNAQWMSAEGEAHGNAVSRQYDEDILKVAAVYDSNAYSRDGLTGNLTYTTMEDDAIETNDLIECVAMLKDEDADADCQFVFPAIMFKSFAKELKEAFWAWTNSTEQLKSGGFGTMFGCTPRPIPQATRRAGHGRLATRSSDDKDTQFFVWNKNAIGLAIGTTETMGVVEWVPHRRSWLIGGEANAGATRIQNAGIIVGTIKQP